jgi:CxxC motif-containing protein (DUF1111 family)
LFLTVDSVVLVALADRVDRQLTPSREGDCMRNVSRYLVLGGLVVGAQGCATDSTDPELGTTEQHAIGDPFAKTDPTAFAAARANFAEPEDINDGLGPVFNERSCGNCHSTPAIGGSGSQVERRYGAVADGTFFGYDRDPDNEGGTLRQLFSVGTYTNGDVTCTIPVEHEPGTATVHNVGRRTTPLFGLGLVDAMPDAWFEFLASTEPAGVRGVVQRTVPAFPDPRDPNQDLTTPRVARFGLKGGVPNLLTFSADAYANEMGITTQSCYRGTSILAFAFDNQSNNVAAPEGCNGGDLAPANPAGDPQVPEFTDDVVGDCDNGRTELQGDLANFLFFMENLAPPPRAVTNPIQFAIGAGQFVNAGCAGCHSAIPFITPAQPFNGVPGNRVFFPFSDFLAHDMGTLGDGIGATGDQVATTRLMRTPPLWGARFNTLFLHDGRATTIRDAILAHDGQGAASRDAFGHLSRVNQNAIIAFVNSL